MSAHYLIRLEDDRGLSIDAVEDTSGVVDDLIVPMSRQRNGQLQYIDPYGTTVFNCVQADALMSEIEDARKIAKSPAAGTLITSIERLARRCCDESHLFLKFYGD